MAIHGVFGTLMLPVFVLGPAIPGYVFMWRTFYRNVPKIDSE